MDDPKPERPAMTPAAELERAARIARESQALRDNLRRRKLQLGAKRDKSDATTIKPDR